MSTGDIPQISHSAYATMAYDNAWMENQNVQHFGLVAAPAPVARTFVRRPDIVQPKEETEAMANVRRLVRVVIMDPNENIPLNDAIIHDSGERFTDLNDQELFFESGIGEKLAAHNEKRIKIRDKAVKDREEMLEPARIRDLKMNVVVIASF